MPTFEGSPMPSSFNVLRRGRRRPSVAVALALALLAVAALAGLAIAKSFTLSVAKNATVINANTNATKHEAIVVSSKASAVYWLTGDSKQHPECTKAKCFKFWPPVTVASAKKLSAAPGIKGKLSTWHRNGLTQAVLGGHPLYNFAPDTKKDTATGEGIVAFGGTWHVLVVPAAKHATNVSTTPMPTPATPYPGYPG
jgi:predicted lipoprotein with Yx(FWY)xxD motif